MFESRSAAATPPRPWPDTSTTPRYRSRRLGRAGAVLTLLCAVLHIAVIPSHLTDGPAPGLTMAVVAALGAGCAWHLWRSPTRGGWLMAGACAATMLGVHLALAAGGTSGTAAALSSVEGMHDHSHHVQSGSWGAVPVMTAATAVAVAETALAVFALVVPARLTGRHR